MTLEARVRRLVEAVPPEGSVVLPVATLRQWLEEAGAGENGAVAPPSAGIDPGLTISTIARMVDRQPSTVRGWVREGQFPNAFTLGREWRIPRQDLARFLTPPPNGEPHAQTPDPELTGGGDLGAWRDEGR